MVVQNHAKVASILVQHVLAQILVPLVIQLPTEGLILPQSNVSAMLDFMIMGLKKPV